MCRRPLSLCIFTASTISGSRPCLGEDPLRLAAVAGQVAADRFDVDVVEESREPPFLFIPAEPPRQRPEDRLGGVAVVQHPFILHVPFEQAFRFVSGHSDLLFSLRGSISV